MAVDAANAQTQMADAFSKAQETQAAITAQTTEHKTIMSVLEAIKNAFQAIKA